MAIAASIRVRRLLLLGGCLYYGIRGVKVLNDFKVIRVVENETGGSLRTSCLVFKLPPRFPYFCPSDRFSVAANFCGSILCFIEPFLTIDMPPVSSDTTTTTASVISLRPIAAR